MGDDHATELKSLLEAGFGQVAGRFDSLDREIDLVRDACQSFNVRVSALEARCDLHQKGAAIRDKRISELGRSLSRYHEDGFTFDTKIRTAWDTVRWVAVAVVGLLAAFASATAIVRFFGK